jgi:hypothetical protein
MLSLILLERRVPLLLTGNFLNVNDRNTDEHCFSASDLTLVKSVNMLFLSDSFKMTKNEKLEPGE